MLFVGATMNNALFFFSLVISKGLSPSMYTLPVG